MRASFQEASMRMAWVMRRRDQCSYDDDGFWKETGNWVVVPRSLNRADYHHATHCCLTAAVHSSTSEHRSERSSTARRGQLIPSLRHRCPAGCKKVPASVYRTV
ncbi:hypothetical protein ElyMa_004807100 [Elysia marginata]|uniref:Uncharacterized protein n=1 Tax=Elysia marginata TaxID=1093978 RepID=A0AAV4IK28_9GAST|nr:hypothetical protein ElyMa_004807100 [Elysia marginata]